MFESADRPAWHFSLVVEARRIGFGSVQFLQGPAGVVLYDGTPGLLKAFSPHSFTVLEREAELAQGLRLVHQPGLQGEELFRENEQGQLMLAQGII